MESLSSQIQFENDPSIEIQDFVSSFDDEKIILGTLYGIEIWSLEENAYRKVQSIAQRPFKLQNLFYREDWGLLIVGDQDGDGQIQLFKYIMKENNDSKCIKNV